MIYININDGRDFIESYTISSLLIGKEIDYTFFLDRISITQGDDLEINILFYSNDIRMSVRQPKHIFPQYDKKETEEWVKSKFFVRKEDEWISWLHIFRFDDFEEFKSFFLNTITNN